jgi:hypothetical protein
MSRKSRLDLTALDDQLIDGLEFCRKAYDLFDEVKKVQGASNSSGDGNPYWPSGCS